MDIAAIFQNFLNPNNFQSLIVNAADAMSKTDQPLGFNVRAAGPCGLDGVCSVNLVPSATPGVPATTTATGSTDTSNGTAAVAGFASGAAAAASAYQAQQYQQQQQQQQQQQRYRAQAQPGAAQPTSQYGQYNQAYYNNPAR